MKSYLAFDFETSGLDPRSERIIQVGFCEVVEGEVLDTGGWLVNQSVRISREAVAVHGITAEKMSAEGIEPRESLTRLFEMMAKAPACIGHNIHRFDIAFMNTEASRLGMPAPASRDYIDTAALFKGWKLGSRKRLRESHGEYAERVLSMRVRGLKFSIPACVKALGVDADLSDAHDAARDAHLTHLIFQRLKGVLGHEAFG